MDGYLFQRQPAAAVDDNAAGLSSAIEQLDEATSWSLVDSVEVGRLAVAAAGDVDIYPVNFAVTPRGIVFRTAEGTKLVEVVISGKVAFEVDGYDPVTGRAWSVVVKGKAELLEKFDEIYEAQDLPLVPWNAAPKERFVLITPERISGRRFVVRHDRAPRVIATS